MKLQIPNFKISTIIKTALFTVIIMSILLYAPSPFVVVKPGLAVSTDTFVERTQVNSSEIGNTEQQGQFLLTAVLMEAPNIWTSLLSIFNANKTVMLKANVMQGNTIEQYSQRATTMMQGSYDYALEAAYRYLNIEYINEPTALYVNDAGALSKANNRLESGDQIVGIYEDDILVAIRSVEELESYLLDQSTLEQLNVEVNRMDKKQTIALTLKNAPANATGDAWVAGRLNVNSFNQLRHIEPVDKQYEVTMNESVIGGPSAGLVLTLTIIDKLTHGDLTQGLRIAATGTINGAGEVGAIGGIKQKVVSTSKEGAVLFIVPKGNAAEASKKGEALHSKMDIAGVESLEEAIQVITSYKAS